jgi:sulfite reductase (ferredoxin)
MSSVSTVEVIKQSSRGLRGTLPDELAEDTDAFTNDACAVLKFHGIYQQDDRDVRRARTAQRLPLAYSCMVRTSVPGGLLTADQWLEMDTFADKVADGSLRLTNRQDVQFHFVAKSGLRPLVSALNEHLLTTLAACGDVVRNTMACPAPHLDGRQHLLEPTVQAIASHLKPRTTAYWELWVDGEKAASLSPTSPSPGSLSPADEGGPGAPGRARRRVRTVAEPIYGSTYLPRKFKIALAWPGDNCVDVHSHDIGLLPLDDGFVVLAGGGMGMTHAREHDTFPRLASVVGWTPAEHVGQVCEAIVTLHRDFGDRGDRARARLKYVLADRGADWFRGALESRLGRRLEDAPPLPEWGPAPEHLGWSEQPDGRWFLGVHVDVGRLRDTEGQRPRAAVRQVLSDGLAHEVRITPRQDLLLCGVARGDRRQVERILRRAGVPLADDLTPVRRLVMACPALPTCGQALGEAERAVPGVVDVLEGALHEHGLDGTEVRVNMTGCPNGCARPYTSEIGIVGRTKTGYDLYVGGSAAGDRLNQRIAVDLPLADLAQAVGPLFGRYAAERRPGESFGDWSARVGADALAPLMPEPRRRRGARAEPGAEATDGGDAPVDTCAVGPAPPADRTDAAGGEEPG